MSDFNSNSVGYIDCYLGYGWGYIGRGLKGGFKFKSGTKQNLAQRPLYRFLVWTGSLDRKSGQKVWTESQCRTSQRNTLER